MHKLKILNSKERKKLIKNINSYFGSNFKTDKTILQDEKGKIFLVNKELANIEFEKLKIEKAGLFFGNVGEKEVTLSIEGSQLIGETQKHTIILSEKEKLEYLSGNSIKSDNKDGIYILVSSNDSLGTAKCRDNKILNALPRNRRINR